jgi:hypothetical protein
MSRRLIVFKRAKPTIENKTPRSERPSRAERRGNHRVRIQSARVEITACAFTPTPHKSPRAYSKCPRGNHRVCFHSEPPQITACVFKVPAWKSLRVLSLRTPTNQRVRIQVSRKTRPRQLAKRRRRVDWREWPIAKTFGKLCGFRHFRFSESRSNDLRSPFRETHLEMESTHH